MNLNYLIITIAILSLISLIGILTFIFMSTNDDYSELHHNNGLIEEIYELDHADKDYLL